MRSGHTALRHGSAASPTTDAYDVIVVGGGMVGSLLAAALGSVAEQRRIGFRVALLEAKPPAPFDAAGPYDLRVSALSLASQRMLEAVGAWSGVASRRLCPFRRMQVWDGEQGGSTTFDGADSGLDFLGHIVENRVVQLALADVLEALPSVDVIQPATPGRFHLGTDAVEVELVDGTVLRTALLVGADGARSVVRRAAGLTQQTSRYDQHALIATVATDLPQQDITWQRFTPAGAQAMLPLQGARASMVWYHSEAEIERLKALDPEAFKAEMVAAFPAQLGGLESIQARGSFPLTQSHAEHYVTERVALIGDAAHTVHPLAGQGVNIGMLDAGVLFDVLVDIKTRRRDIGSARELRAYERRRRGENALMIKTLDGFYHAFRPQPVAAQQIRSQALDMVQRIKPLRRYVMEYAMGLRGDLPTLATAPEDALQ